MLSLEIVIIIFIKIKIIIIKFNNLTFSFIGSAIGCAIGWAIFGLGICLSKSLSILGVRLKTLMDRFSLFNSS